ncbi:hypothetical protein T265_00009 [Opisthorchis viverrini]|uniref:Uncharacterized protein n=1 Tax=Opisthorchis viverrini TaxID=6198 RepID=A0A075A433_OPIVI|nr:hypothetical protein T265_00009 [Opisthorchis viverrini]KER34121.1 hypothetical protein T265_00009 [Opisthorchis viverrini]
MAQRLRHQLTDRKVRGLDNLAVFQPSCLLPVAWQLGTEMVLRLNVFIQQWVPAVFMTWFSKEKNETAERFQCTLRARWTKWLERGFDDRKVRGSKPTSVSRLPLSRLGQHGIIPALVTPSCGIAARHRKGAIAERFFLQCTLFYVFYSIDTGIVEVPDTEL